jgi:hypothetical protein
MASKAMVNTHTHTHTCSAGVVHHDDLGEQACGGGVQDAVHGSEEGGPGLVVEHYDHTGGW